MHFDPRKLFEDGFIVLRGVVPPDWLGPLRDSFERMVDRQRDIWARERKPGDPPGGAWETGHQPRLQFETLVDGETADTMAFCLHEHTMGVSRRIMDAEAAGNTGFMFMCNPVTDRGPAAWHRDIHPIDQAPLRGLQDDLLHNAPGYLQWNIPLYDDNVLWVVPNSHRRGNTSEENRCLAQNPREPLPGGVQVELNAGDGVVYTNTILHWGSKLQRQDPAHHPPGLQVLRRADFFPTSTGPSATSASSNACPPICRRSSGTSGADMTRRPTGSSPFSAPPSTATRTLSRKASPRCIPVKQAGSYAPCSCPRSCTR